jgi:chromate transporter
MTPPSSREVFLAFLKLGVTAFGGPVAHLAHFRNEFVGRRQWLSEPQYADLVALCQFLPGPASSQVGMALGLKRAGWSGALAAWLGFTLPSALMLIACALALAAMPAWSQSGAFQGLKVVAVAVVAHAVWHMAKALCPDAIRKSLAVGSAAVLLWWPGPVSQIGVMLGGALVGLMLLPAPPDLASAPQPHMHTHMHMHTVSPRASLWALAVFAALLIGLPLWAAWSTHPLPDMLAVFFQSGALVFGGGHVVLPMLQTGVVAPGWVSEAAFLAGYGVTQAMPGPLFSFSAYLGALMPAPFGGLLGGLTLLCVLFLPAFLVLVAALPWWHRGAQHPGIRRAMGGLQAAVVGLLAAAWYDPVCTHAITSWRDAALAALALVLLSTGRVPMLGIVCLTALAGWLQAA